MSKKETADAPQKKKRKSSKLLTLALIIGSLGMIVLFRTGFIFFMIGILPSIVAYYIDRTKSHTTFHTVLACNLSGLIPFMADLVREGSKAGVTTDIMGSGMNWLIIYASAGFGWMLVYTTPLFAQFLITMFHQGQISRFEAMQHRIVEDWGSEVANFFPKEKTDEII